MIAEPSDSITKRAVPIMSSSRKLGGTDILQAILINMETDPVAPDGRNDAGKEPAGNSMLATGL